MAKSTLSVGTKVWAKKINAAWRESAAKIIDVGRALLEAKASVPHGDFEKLLKNELDFVPATARKLMAIAKDNRLQNVLSGHALPGHWTTIYELHKLDDGQLETALAGDRTRVAVQQIRAPKPTVIDVQHEDITGPADARPGSPAKATQAMARALPPGNAIVQGEGADTPSNSSADTPLAEDAVPASQTQPLAEHTADDVPEGGTVVTADSEGGVQELATIHDDVLSTALPDNIAQVNRLNTSLQNAWDVLEDADDGALRIFAGYLSMSAERLTLTIDKLMSIEALVRGKAEAAE